MSDTQPKVLYIAGAGRSGSTILHNVLGQIIRFVGVGELGTGCDRQPTLRLWRSVPLMRLLAARLPHGLWRF